MGGLALVKGQHGRGFRADGDLAANAGEQANLSGPRHPEQGNKQGTEVNTSCLLIPTFSSQARRRGRTDVTPLLTNKLLPLNARRPAAGEGFDLL